MSTSEAAVVIVVDLDDRNCLAFKEQLLSIAAKCCPGPRMLFRIAIEEMEAWLLGDRTAVRRAYPKARQAVLDSYRQDSICGTWETLADAVYPGGARALKEKGYPRIGQEKFRWAEKIAPHMEIRRNLSPSFQVFVQGIRRLCGENR
ncbi:MAG: DUF4276 family protein [Bryobacterales bacterium]|nr:DUF4276 family protein [Bryobacterales bacterium]